MRTHIKTNYSDIEAFEESYPRFVEKFKQDSEASLLIKLGEWDSYNDRVYAHAFVCTQCGHEYYTDWRNRYISFYYSDYMKSQIPAHQSVWEIGKSPIHERYNKCEKTYKKYACTQDHSSKIEQKYKSFCKSDKARCPICNATWENSPQGHACTQISLRNNHSDAAHQRVIEDLFKSIHANKQEAYKKDAEVRLAALETSMNAVGLGGGIAELVRLASTKELIGYISKILTLETNIVSLKKWLGSLYQQEPYAIAAVKERSLFMQKEPTDKLNELRHKLEELNAVDCVSEVKRKNIKRKKVTYPELPQEPVYEKPGLFNKKKIEAENDQKRARFEMARMEYNRALAECTHQQKIYDDEYNEELKRAESEYLRLCEESKIRHEKTLQECKEAITKWEYEISKLSDSEFIANTPENALKNILAADIANAEDLLKRTYDARKQLYDCNIIFGKYRNPVALATFYEYLISGRCVGLDGSDGAYNLYESEIRANMIIFQLSEVIENLEKIKENQFTIYSQLSDMNYALNQLNSTMHSAVGELKGIKENTAVISENTAVIAHNTAATAYYAKKNAELTDALGYLVALK